MGLLDWASERLFGKKDAPEKKDSAVDVVPPEDLEEPKLDTDAEIVSYVEKLFSEWKSARYAYEVAWFQNFANFLGFQYHNWSELTRSLSEGRAPSYRVKMVVNLMMPAILTYLGKFMRGDPTFRARPGEPSDMAFGDARVGDKVLRSLWRKLDGTDEELELLLWMLICGDGFWKVGWDPTTGKRVEFPGFEAVSLGEVHWDTFGPWPIFTPPDQGPLYKPSQLIDARIRSMQWLARTFGRERASLAKADGDLSDQSSFEYRLTSLVSPQVASGSNRKPRVGFGAVVKEYWSDPETLSEEERDKYPHGRLIIVAGGALMYKSDSPNIRDSKHPYVHFRAEQIPGRAWGSSRMDQASPLQKSYNRGRSMLKEAMNLTANPVIDVEQGHGIVAFTAEPGALAERKKGWAAPVFRKTPEVSQAHAETVKLDKEDLEEVFQTRAATKGETPSANITGVAIELLQEADNNPLTPLALRIARGLGRVMTKTLNRTQENYSEDRYLEVTGEGCETEVMLFRADEHQTELRVECVITSILPASKAARQNRVETATRLGYLDPMKDRALGLRMLEFGDDDQLWEIANRHRQKQLRENQKLQQGLPVPVDEWDDDEAHLLAMMPDMVSAEWETWPPEVQQAYVAHRNMHLDKMARVNQAMSQPALGNEPRVPETPAVAGGLGELTQGGDV